MRIRRTSKFFDKVPGQVAFGLQLVEVDQVLVLDWQLEEDVQVLVLDGQLLVVGMVLVEQDVFSGL